MPREVIVPPPDPPVIVEDDKYSTRAPTNDREDLCKALVYLSEKLYDALELDQQDNSRYARRLRLVNHKYDEARKLIRDQFEVGLPLEASAWNDLDQEYIKVCLLSTVVNIEPNYHWFKLEVEFHQFISHQTKILMDKMDEEAQSLSKTILKTSNSSMIDVACTPAKNIGRPSTSFVDATPDVNLGELRNRQSVQNHTPETNPRIIQHKIEVTNEPSGSETTNEKKPSFIKDKPASVVEISIDDDDDDDDIKVVFECVAPSKRAMKTSNR